MRRPQRFLCGVLVEDIVRFTVNEGKRSGEFPTEVLLRHHNGTTSTTFIAVEYQNAIRAATAILNDIDEWRIALVKRKTTIGVDVESIEEWLNSGKTYCPKHIAEALRDLVRQVQ